MKVYPQNWKFVKQWKPRYTLFIKLITRNSLIFKNSNESRVLRKKIGFCKHDENMTTHYLFVIVNNSFSQKLILSACPSLLWKNDVKIFVPF